VQRLVNLDAAVIVDRPFALFPEIQPNERTHIMPPPKKGAKKAAKKAAKHHPGHRQTSDLRRAYEHMSRVEILQRSLKPSDAKVVTTLATLAREQLEAGNNQQAADLLRGAEHLSIAALADQASKKVRLSAELVQSITERFNELTGRAEEHWLEHKEEPGVFTAIYKNSRKNATAAFKHGAYHQALELARATEALAHVSPHGAHKMKRGEKVLRLTAV
jgi:hypothetical protein